MDQGIAGVIAGIAGLLGAGVGGLATAYGARIGAQKTIEAAQTQVAQQSAAQHRQWLREQRRQACFALVDAFGTFARVAVDCATAVENEQALPEGHREELMDHTEQLVIEGAHMQLWGPPQLVAAIDDMSGEAIEFLALMTRWERIRRTGESPATLQHQEACEDRWTAVKEARDAFMLASQAALTHD
ncbi:hypothetical protein [Streptomyces massasporeus]|uniref:hypothetical protein n=1 Tax=Streptomyces massasporeus TaxID=67324 RepID=UPI003665A06C